MPQKLSHGSSVLQPESLTATAQYPPNPSEDFVAFGGTLSTDHRPDSGKDPKRRFGYAGLWQERRASAEVPGPQ